MQFKMNRRTMMATSAAARFASGSTVLADGHATMHEVQMLNQDPNEPRNRQVFEPRIIVVKPGDTVKFLATDPGHNSEYIPEMSPEGVEGWEGRIGEEVEFVAETPGFYGYKCTPHASVGMVGLVIVEGEGMMENFEAAQEVRQRGRARQVWDEIWEEVEGMEFNVES
ncbi:MAG: pseudoazurin [Pseudomonadota bacterium]